MVTQGSDGAPEARGAETRWSAGRAGDGGMRIGPYKTLGVLGEGGFGVVYLAEQSEPIRRRVALKVIKPGMDSRAVIARFEAERQALALMDHPNVAKVYDAGATEQGRPYFVMEHVTGEPITEHCDRHRLTVNERLELFVQVCEAVQHAHQKGVIHRDIKPSNILVTMRDGKAIPKIIDFGVAKAISQPLTEKTVYTQQGQLIGTPSYMSPEQVEMTIQDIDTRTDIYSLGVLLYELLTGSLPFNRASLKEAPFGEVQRIIREVEPPKPSAKLRGAVTPGGDETLKQAARNRRSEPRGLSRDLRGDLDDITRKALEKERTRRYQSAFELADDIRRHLRHEPVLAGPPGAGYRLRKFVRRHRAVAAGTAAVAVALLAGTIVSTWQAYRAREAEGLAGERLVEAESEAAKARAVLDFLRGMMTSADPEVDGQDVRVVEVLDRAAQELRAGAVAEPEIEAAVRTAIGATYLGLGRLDAAEAQLRRALEMRIGLLGEKHADVAETLFDLAWLLKERGDLAEAETTYRRCLAIRRETLGGEHAQVMETKHDLGIVLLENGELDQAEGLLREVLEVRRRRKGDTDSETATTMTVLGELLRRRGDYDKAEAMHREALRIYRSVHGQQHSTVARASSNLASVLRQLGRLEEAEALAREALEIRRVQCGEKHSTVASSLVTLAVILSDNGRYEEAEPLLREALTIYRGTHGELHSYVAGTRLRLAEVLDNEGDSTAAAEEFTAVIEMYAAVDGPEHWHVANARSGYGACLMRLGRLEEAERELLGAQEVLSAAGLAGVAQTNASRLADLYTAWGKEADAARWQALASSDEPAEGH
ncbi:MAG TPA: serine/threonine-protein kinase [Phycisphaerae bacterium]|nr:serine/threonine-protein kinase [Phycisphaerae bacterium]